MIHESDHTCPRCRGGSDTPGLCPGCQYIRRVWGTELDRHRAGAAGTKGARGLDRLREEMGVPDGT